MNYSVVVISLRDLFQGFSDALALHMASSRVCGFTDVGRKQYFILEGMIIQFVLRMITNRCSRLIN